MNNTSEVKVLVEKGYNKPTFLTHIGDITNIDENISLNVEKKFSPIAYKLLSLIVFHMTVNNNKNMEIKVGNRFYLNKKFTRQLILGWEEKRDDTIYQALRELYNNSLIINYLGKDYAFKKISMRFLTSIGEPTDKGHYYSFVVNPDIEEYMKKSVLYGNQTILMIATLSKPKYCYRFYELLIDAYGRNENPFKIDLESLIIQIGFSEDSIYNKGWYDFNKHLLNPSIQKINKSSDIKVEYKPYKEGKKVIGCIFTIKKQKWEMQVNDELFKMIEKIYLEEQPKIVLVGEKIQKEEKEETQKEDEIQNFITEIFKEYNISEQAVNKAIELYGFEGVKEIKEYALSMNKKSKKNNFTSYMANCFHKGLGIKTKDERQKDDEKNKIKIINNIGEEKKELIEKIKKGGNELYEKKFKEIKDKLSIEKLEEYKNKFHLKMEAGGYDSYITNIYNIKKFQDTGIKILFNIFLKEQLIKSKEDYYNIYAKSINVDYDKLLKE